MNGQEPKAFIFDLDGVIVNTVGLHFQAWKRLFDELGIPFDRATMDRFRGVHQREILLSLADGLSEAQISLLLARKGSLYQQALLDSSASLLNEPVARLLEAVKARGLKVGLASSSINAHFVLKTVQLFDWFDAIADGTTVCRSKPAPDIFIWVAGALGVRPTDAVVVEDGAAGIQAARTAGMFTVGLDLATTAPTCTPHLHLAMADLELEVILAHFLSWNSVLALS